MMRNRRTNLPLTLVTAALVILIAGLAGSTLVLLRQMHGRSAHAAAAETVIRQGKAMVSRLASQPSINSTETDDVDWSEFSRLIRSLYSVEDGLQYVSVTRDDVVLFHEQTRLLDGSQTAPSPTPLVASGKDVAMRREVLHVGDEVIPVVVFALDVPAADGTSARVSVALRKDTVNREEQAAETAITSMFRLTLLTIVVSFAICTLLVVWMMKREIEREKMRRKEEHLSFSGMLANGIVHDFRNPMSSMRLDVQMLARETKRDAGPRPERIQRLAERVRGTLDRMDKVFQEFLYASRPDKETPSTVDLVTCMKDCMDMLAARFEQSGVRTELTASSTPVTALAYEGSLRRALVNVLTNAEQFSPKDSTVRINVTTEGTSGIMTVSDSGPGIPKPERGNVFDMFVTSRPEGTGLGLFLARAAIERSGGTIQAVDTEDGRGVCIRIQLPLASGTETAELNDDL